MILLDGTVVNVALPSAQRDLGFSDAARPWVITAYVLAFGSLLPLGGRLADVVGRKTMFMTGLVGFALASALGGAAPNIGTLLAARAVQGAFAAALAPAALSLLVVTFTDLKELNKAFAVFGAVAGSAGAIGLLLGGVLTDYASWRWCMYINIIFAVIAGAGGLSLLHNSRDANRPRLSIPSTILGSAALFGLVFGSAKAETNGWSAAVTITSLVAGGVLLVIFVVLQKYEKHPLIPLRVIADRNRGAAYLALFLTYGAMFAMFLFLTYYIQDVKGYSPIITGVAFLPIPVTIGVAATITQGLLLRHLTMRTIVSGGLILAAAGAVLLTRADATSNYAAWLLPSMILMGIGIGSAGVVAIAIGPAGRRAPRRRHRRRDEQRRPASRLRHRRSPPVHPRRHRHQPLPDPATRPAPALPSTRPYTASPSATGGSRPVLRRSHPRRCADPARHPHGPHAKLTRQANLTAVADRPARSATPAWLIPLRTCG